MRQNEMQHLWMASQRGKGPAGQAVERKRVVTMKEFEVYRGNDTDLVDVIHARSYEQAVWIARKKGYGKGFRIVEVKDNG